MAESTNAGALDWQRELTVEIVELEPLVLPLLAKRYRRAVFL